MHCGTLQEYQPSGEPFDLIAMTHVLEHIPAPTAALAQLRDLTTSGGSLLLEVPNANDILLPLFGGSYRPLCPGDHVSFFDETSLARVLDDAGWQVQSVVSPLHARDVFYGSVMSGLDWLRSGGGHRPSGGGGVNSQTRYRGRFRQPLKQALDAVVEAVDPMVVWAHEQLLQARRGAVLIVHARRANG